MARKVISNLQYLSANKRFILRNVKNDPSDDLQSYLTRDFERYSENYSRYPGALEKPNKSLWQSYFKKKF